MRVLVTGVSGQDGTYLAELLRSRGDEVVGVCRGEASPRVRAVADVRRLDLTDHAALDALVREVTPDRLFHLAAYHRSSSASPSDRRSEAGGRSATALPARGGGWVPHFGEESDYLATNLLSVHALLASVRAHAPACRVFLAGSAHMFGDAAETPQSEATPFAPNSLYGVTKVASCHLARVYREQHGVFACTGILYNHESPLRGPSFVTTRLARAAARGEDVTLGDPAARVDWGYAGDYVEAMRLMLEAPAPRDYVVASGGLHTVQDFAERAFAHAGRDWRAHVKVDPSAHKPVARATYHGDSSAIARDLGWRPTTTFAALVAMMVDAHRAT